MSTTVYLHLHSGKLCVGVTQVLRPTCKISTAHSQQQCLEPVPSGGRKWASHGVTTAPGPAGATAAQQASTPGAVSACIAQISFPEPPGTERLHTGHVFTGPLSVPQTRDCLEKIGELWEPLGTEGILQGRGASECHCLCPLHLRRVSGGSVQVVWPTCKVAAAYSRTHVSSPFQP